MRNKRASSATSHRAYRAQTDPPLSRHHSSPLHLFVDTLMQTFTGSNFSIQKGLFLPTQRFAQRDSA